MLSCSKGIICPSWLNSIDFLSPIFLYLSTILSSTKKVNYLHLAMHCNISCVKTKAKTELLQSILQSRLSAVSAFLRPHSALQEKSPSDFCFSLGLWKGIMGEPVTFGFDEDYNYDVTFSYGITNATTDTVPVHNIILSVLYTIIFLLGIFGNGIVIWISGFRMKKSVNTAWYLSLAVSDFIFCACLPFTVAYLATSNWLFGLVMCKFTSFVMFLNMFSSIFLLVLISMDRCVTVVFPVWSQNHRTVRAASVLVLLSWIISVVLSVPSLVFRDIKLMKKTICYNNYKEKEQIHLAIATSRFIFGFVIPFLIITLSYIVIIHKLKTNRMTKSSKPFKVMSALIATFFICWLPYHIFNLLELDHEEYRKEVLDIGIKVSVFFATANSFLNPLLYAFMGKDFKKIYWNCVLSKIENALSDDVQSSTKGQSNTQDSKVSTNI